MTPELIVAVAVLSGVISFWGQCIINALRRIEKKDSDQ